MAASEGSSYTVGSFANCARKQYESLYDTYVDIYRIYKKTQQDEKKDYTQCINRNKMQTISMVRDNVDL